MCRPSRRMIPQSSMQRSSRIMLLRSAQSRCPPDTLRRLSLLFNKKGKIKSQQRLDNQLIFMIAYKQILGSSSHRVTGVVLVVITLVKPQAVANRAVHFYRNGTRLLLYIYHAIKVFFCVINKGSGYII